MVTASDGNVSNESIIASEAKDGVVIVSSVRADSPSEESELADKNKLFFIGKDASLSALVNSLSSLAPDSTLVVPLASLPAPLTSLFLSSLQHSDHRVFLAPQLDPRDSLAPILARSSLSYFALSTPSPKTILVIPGTVSSDFETYFNGKHNSDLGVMRVNVYRPWSVNRFLETLPPCTQRVIVLDTAPHYTDSNYVPTSFSASSTRFGFLFLDVAASLQQRQGQIPIKPLRVRGTIVEKTMDKIFDAVYLYNQQASGVVSIEPIEDIVGDMSNIRWALSKSENSFANIAIASNSNTAADLEMPYISLLAQLFKDRLNLSNVLLEQSVLKPESTPLPIEIDDVKNRAGFISQTSALLRSGILSKGVSSPLQAWLNAVSGDGVNVTAKEIMKLGRRAHDALGAACSYQTALQDYYQESGPHLLFVATNVNRASTDTAESNVKQVAGTTAEFGLGLHLSQIQHRNNAISTTKIFLAANVFPPQVVSSLQSWLSAQSNPTSTESTTHGQAAYKLLADHPNPTTEITSYITTAAKHLLSPPPSRWILGSDRLTTDINASGVHHVITSGQNINILILDTQPYTDKKDPSMIDKRKKDVGLYAMTYGGVYVASVSLQTSFSGFLRALTEADAYPGPSVVVAYSPHIENTAGVSTALAALKQVKLAVDEGYWPLYRWHPDSTHPENAKFTLDSTVMRSELEAFLERDAHVTLVARGEVADMQVAKSVETELREVVERKILREYEDMIDGMNLRAVSVVYGSDGGVAAGAAKRLAGEAKQRGFKPKVGIMDDYAVEDFSETELIVFVVSTAGQGEFPGNARETWKSLSALKKGDLDFSKMQFAVFAMGDSHYWPNPGDEIYFCKSGKDLDEKLAFLGGKRLVNVGLGDDRGADGWQTGYRVFTDELWAALGADAVQVSSGGGVMVPTDDAIKEASNYLRGSIAPGLVDTTTGALSDLDGKITKFHGIYQQDDRDIREARLRAALEPAYSFMVRVRIPGGVATPQQWIAVDEISNKLANGTIKITTRQAFQFHGIVKGNLKKSIQEINHALMDTIAACGDVNRNVMCNPNPGSPQVHAQVLEFSLKFSEHLLPNTNAYHEIWLDKKLVVTSEDVEPIYGKTYLPRKFKVAVAVPPFNDVDVFAHDLGYIAIVERDIVVGYNVTVGGGMGMTHGMKTTYPRLGDLLGFVTPDQAVAVGEKVVLVQRDYGDRTNRKHARLKYTIDDRGIDWFRSEVEDRLGYKLQPARPYKFISNMDRYGWSNNGVPGTKDYTIFIQNGRCKDDAIRMLKTGLRAIADDFIRRNIPGIEFRLTPNQHLIISGIPDSETWKFEAFLKKYGLENGSLSGLRKGSMACVALPTCALAMAESERYLPDLVGKIEEVLEVNGLRDTDITIRMTGCPNGCARPQIAEIAFVGKAPGTYNMYLGGGFTGERLNKIFKENVTEPDIIRELTPLIQDYAKSRIDGEHFGDFVIRRGYVKATTAGRNFHDV